MTSFKSFEKFGRTYVPASMTGIGKKVISKVRYRSQRKLALEHFEKFGKSYPNNLMFIAGLPKSGTTWLENLVVSQQQIVSVMPPDAVAHEQDTGGSHNYELRAQDLDDLANALALMKLHCHGSDNNLSLLRDRQIPIVALFRDLRDVAVSYVFYVKKTPYHPEHRIYKSRSVADSLHEFGSSLLSRYSDWIDSWKRFEHEQDVLVSRYEDMHANTQLVLRQVFDHFGIKATDSELHDVVESKSFKKMSTGESNSKVDSSTFFRKGTIGDWVNHFDQREKDLYKEIIGDQLITLGYENDDNW